MNKNQAKSFILVVYATIIVFICRIILPLLFDVDSSDLLKDFKSDAVRVFIVIISVLLLVTNLIILSFCAFYFGNELLLAMFSPFFFIAIIGTYALLVEGMLPNLGTEGVNKYVSAAWANQLKNNDSLMSQLQIKLKCCGMKGPTDYLLYMEKIHSSCFQNSSGANFTKLFKSGCNEILKIEFEFVHYMAAALTWLTIAIEFTGLVISTGPLTRRIFYGSSDNSLPKISVY